MNKLPSLEESKRVTIRKKQKIVGFNYIEGFGEISKNVTVRQKLPTLVASNETSSPNHLSLVDLSKCESRENTARM